MMARAASELMHHTANWVTQLNNKKCAQRQWRLIKSISWNQIWHTRWLYVGKHKAQTLDFTIQKTVKNNKTLQKKKFVLFLIQMLPCNAKLVCNQIKKPTISRQFVYTDILHYCVSFRKPCNEALLKALSLLGFVH